MKTNKYIYIFIEKKGAASLGQKSFEYIYIIYLFININIYVKNGAGGAKRQMGEGAERVLRWKHPPLYYV